MKRRLLGALLSLCLFTGLFTAVAYAGEIVADNIAATQGDRYAEFNADAAVAYQKGIDIYAQAFDNATNSDKHVYQVEIVWGDMAFAWGDTEKITKTWNATDHTYSTNERTMKWYLIDETTPLTLEYNADGSYDSIVADTRQNYVLLFNHSDMPVNASVTLTDIMNDVEDLYNADYITATLTDASFGATGTANSKGGFDYQLKNDAQTGVVYSKDNQTAAALSVALENEPAQNVLNETNPTTVARITVSLSIPTEPDVEQGESED